MSVKKPCTDCTLVLMNGGIQYADGTEAVGPSVYLHHAAIINTGPEAKDGTCGRPAYDLFFSTGNERSTIIYNNPNSTIAAGYYIHPSDNFLLQSEVINNELQEKEVYIYFNYEYIPGKMADQRQTKVAWLSAAASPCSSKMDPKALLGALDPKNDNGEPKLSAGEMYPPNDKKFTLKSEPWVSPWTGNFVALGKNELCAYILETDTSYQVAISMMVELTRRFIKMANFFAIPERPMRCQIRPICQLLTVLQLPVIWFR